MEAILFFVYQWKSLSFFPPSRDTSKPNNKWKLWVSGITWVTALLYLTSSPPHSSLYSSTTSSERCPLHSCTTFAWLRTQMSSRHLWFRWYGSFLSNCYQLKMPSIQKVCFLPGNLAGVLHLQDASHLAKSCSQSHPFLPTPFPLLTQNA